MSANEKLVWKFLSGRLDHKCNGYNGRQPPFDKYNQKYDGCRCDDTNIPESKWCNGCLTTLLDKLLGMRQ